MGDDCIYPVLQQALAFANIRAVLPLGGISGETKLSLRVIYIVLEAITDEVIQPF